MCDKAAYHVTIRSRNIKLGRKKKQVEQALVMVMLAGNYLQIILVTKTEHEMMLS